MSGYTPGDIQVIELQIKGGDFTKSFVKFDIYESIFMPGIVANITLLDADDFINNQKIAGGEEVSISFRPPGGKTAEYKLIVNAVKNESSTPGMHSKSYVVECVSEEVANARDKYVSKTYDNKQFSDMVKDVFEEFIKSKKKLEIEDTKGIQKYVVPTQKPFEAIDGMRRRSISPENKSSSYMFFENQKGFNFVTLEKIIKEANIVKEFVQDAATGADFLGAKYNNIIAVKNPQQMSATETTSSGYHKQTIKTFNFHTLKYEQKTITKPEKETKTAGRGERIPNSYDSKHKDESNLNAVMPVNNEKNTGARGKSYMPEHTAQQRAFADALASSALRMTVFGDTELMAGVMITANLLKKQQNTTAAGQDDKMSGNMLITGLRHRVNAPGSRPRYVCDMECVKGGYEESFG